MKTRAAVAFAPKQPLEIVELDLEGTESRPNAWKRLLYSVVNLREQERIIIVCSLFYINCIFFQYTID